MKNPVFAPAGGYEEAARRIEQLLAQDGGDVNPVSRSILLTHGHKTEKAIVLFHGYTNSPRQFYQLGGLFFERGYNVFIPRAPFHGLKDRMTTATASLTAEGLLDFASQSVDLAAGLGERVTVAGISMGGVLSLWAGLYRAEVVLAAPISPALAFRAIPLALTAAVAKTMLALPNQFNWWDPAAKDAPVPPLHAYPRYATHGLAHIVDIGTRLRVEARRNKPLAGRLQFVINPTDESVDHRYALEIFHNWQKLGAGNVSLYEFDPRYNLIHDLIEPEQPKQQVGVVYPQLLALLDG